MTSFSKQLSFRWSDLDPNFHVRHSAYYDFGAHRIEILESLGLTMKVYRPVTLVRYSSGKNVFSERNRAFWYDIYA
jgi:acyl-CoA thioesterase FadM